MQGPTIALRQRTEGGLVTCPHGHEHGSLVGLIAAWPAADALRHAVVRRLLMKSLTAAGEELIDDGFGMRPAVLAGGDTLTSGPSDRRR